MQQPHTSRAEDRPDDRAEQSLIADTQPVPFPERVARRAYERFQLRGSEHGHDQEDWFEAERELKETSG